MISDLLTLPYRLWMLALGYYCWCDKCHTIVLGGFGYTGAVNGEQKFMCMPCADDVHRKKINKVKLTRAAKLDPNKKESI